MTDIVERLRHQAEEWTFHGDDFYGPLFSEAADEIERLRVELGKTERDLERALAALDHHMKVDR